jgi:hypothetical protein
MNKRELIPVIYIAGAGRSGSTILGEVLGMLSGAVHLGEVRGLFDYTVDPSELYVCSCGQLYRKCAFWNPLFTKLFGKDWPNTVSKFGVQGRLPSMKSLLWRQFTPRVNTLYIDRVAKTIPVVKAALIQSSSFIVIDSSKGASFAWLLAQTGEVNLLIVHLVRDPRGVLYSWMRHAIPIHDAIVGRSTLRTRAFYESLIQWILPNGGAHLLQFLGLPYMRIKYEDFVADPDKTVNLVIQNAKKVEIPLQGSVNSMDLLKNRKVLLKGHLIAGNSRVKTKQGVVPIELDDSWKYKLSVWEKAVLNIIFSPWLIFYGYFGKH